MVGREREIVKNFDLCATLMSDPDMLRKYPEIVANQFYVTKNSIETLRTFLVPRSAATDQQCGCHLKSWLDSSIISKGIGQLVDKMLDTHMGVVRRGYNDFPQIVKEDFKVQVPDKPEENNFIREIKESSCMGAVVLLYYYLYWYLFLILMNKRTSDDASYCCKNKLDIQWLTDHLPKTYDFLEFRYVGEAFKLKKGEDAAKFKTRIDSLHATQATQKFMHESIVPGSTELKRCTILIPAYRRVLNTTLGGVTNEFDYGVDLPETFAKAPSLLLFNSITAEVVTYGMLVMGGMASVFERQSATQKWEDMHSPVQVGILGKPVGKQETAIVRLANVLSKLPYSNDKIVDSWEKKGRKICLYDYCSASVMMDVCKSFQKLAGLVKSLLTGKRVDDSSTFPKFIISFLCDLSGLSRGRSVIESMLKSKATRDSNKLCESDDAFVSKTDDTILIGETYKKFGFQRTDRHTTPLWLDRFKCLYPSRNCISSNEVNHRCFMWDLGDSKHTKSDSLLVIQDELISLTHDDGKTTTAHCTAYALAILCPLLRNTWMLKYGTESASELLSKLMTVSHFMNASLDLAKEDEEKYPEGIPPPKPLLFDCVTKSDFIDVIESKTLVLFLPFTELGQYIYGEDRGVKELSTVIGVAGDRLGQIPITLTDILAFTVKQRTALAALVEESNKFVRYPALMWPVDYGNGGGDSNYTSFSRVKKDRSSSGKPGNQPVTHPLESTVKNVAVSVERIALVAEGLVAIANGYVEDSKKAAHPVADGAAAGAGPG